MPTTWARQWMNASEEILILQTQPNESVYSGHKYSDHFPPSILLCVSLYQTYHNFRPQLFTVPCSRAWRVAQTFRELFFKWQWKPNSTATSCCFGTAQNLLKIIQCSCGTRVPEIPNIHWKSKTLTLYLHHPREARLLSVVRSWHHYSRSHSTAFLETNLTFHELLLRNTHLSLLPQRRLG